MKCSDPPRAVPPPNGLRKNLGTAQFAIAPGFWRWSFGWWCFRRCSAVAIAMAGVFVLPTGLAGASPSTKNSSALTLNGSSGANLNPDLYFAQAVAPDYGNTLYLDYLPSTAPDEGQNLNPDPGANTAPTFAPQFNPDDGQNLPPCPQGIDGGAGFAPSAPTGPHPSRVFGSFSIPDDRIGSHPLVWFGWYDIVLMRWRRAVRRPWGFTHWMRNNERSVENRLSQ